MSFEEEMSRFEAEIRRTQSGMAAAALAGGGGGGPPRGMMPMGGHHPFRTNPGGFVPSQVRAASLNPHTNMFNAATSAPVISAPPNSNDNAAAAKADNGGGDDEDIFAKLQQYETQHKKEKKLKKKKKKEEKSGGDKAAAGSSSSATLPPTHLPPPPVPKAFTPVAQGTKNAPVSATIGDDAIKKAKQRKRMIRTGGGQIWEDDSLKEWDPNDFRLFAGDLGNDVTDEVLARTFGRYPSFTKAKVIRDKRTNKTKGYGFVSFKDPTDFTKAVKELNGKYVGSRPIKLRKSNWRERNIDVVRQKQKMKQNMGYKW